MQVLSKNEKMSSFNATNPINYFSDVSLFSGTTERHKIAAHTRQYQSKHYHERHFSGPFFEGPLNTSAGALNAAVHLYTEGIFNCRVGMLKDKTVSSYLKSTLARPSKTHFVQ